MISFKPWLRRVVGEQDLKVAGIQLLRFAAFKLPITVLSVLSLLAMKQIMPSIFWASFINSMLAQIIEFMVLRDKVFTHGSSDKRVVFRQFLFFWSWAVFLGVMEGALLHLFEGWRWNFYFAYSVAHVPTFTLRFLGDKRIIFGKLNGHQTPSSS